MTLLVLTFVLWCGSSVRAATERRFDITSEKLWDALVKSIAVDLNYEIVQKDRDVGFVLFRKAGSTVEKPYSAEVIKGDEKKGDKPRVRINLADRPLYEEILVLDRLTTRVREDRL